jgi:hypothetical protein
MAVSDVEIVDSNWSNEYYFIYNMKILFNFFTWAISAYHN